MKNDISHVIVRVGDVIAAMLAGRRAATRLAPGRYECEGQVVRDGSKYVRLRSAAGRLYVVAESDLLSTSGKVRRVYRGGAVPQSHTSAAVEAEVCEITPEQRSEVRQQLWASQGLKRRSLGNYTQCGSVDSWTVRYSIERTDGKWTVTMEGPEDYEDEVTAYVGSEGRLAEDAWDIQYDPDDLIGDLRSSGEPQLVALAEEIEAQRTADAVAGER